MEWLDGAWGLKTFTSTNVFLHRPPQKPFAVISNRAQSFVSNFEEARIKCLPVTGCKAVKPHDRLL